MGFDKMTSDSFLARLVHRRCVLATISLGDDYIEERKDVSARQARFSKGRA